MWGPTENNRKLPGATWQRNPNPGGGEAGGWPLPQRGPRNPAAAHLNILLCPDKSGQSPQGSRILQFLTFSGA